MIPFGLKFSQMILHTETRKTDVQLILSLCSFAQANTLTQYIYIQSSFSEKHLYNIRNKFSDKNGNNSIFSNIAYIVQIM